MNNRRDFICKATALSAGLLGAFNMESLALNKLVGHAPPQKTFDLHCHPGVFFARGVEGWYPGDQLLQKTLDDMRNGGMSGAFFALVSDGPLLKREEKGIAIAGKFGEGEAWQEYKRQLALFKELAGRSELEHCTTLEQWESSQQSGRIAAFLACEGGDFIEGVELLEEAYDDGVRSVQVVHYVPNHLGDLQTADSMHDGLSSMGREVIKKMNSLGMVIDVAHASFKTVKDVVSLTDAPLILSHSILKMEPSRPIGKRAISEDHARAVASTGGVIGAWPSGFSKSFDEYVDNTMRLVDVVGIDHVGLGTDMDANYKPVLDNYNQLDALQSGLRKKGLTKKEVGQIMGGNAERVLNEVIS